MQQVVGAFERVRRPELLPEDAHRVFAAQRAHAVGLGGPGEHALAEGLLALARQDGGAARLLARGDGLDAAVAVGVAPPLHKILAAPQHGLNGAGLLAGERETNGAVTVALFSVAFAADAAVEFGQVLGTTKRHMHGGPPCLGWPP